MAKRKVDSGAFDIQKPKKAFCASLRQTIIIKQGIKGMKATMQVAIQGEELRVSGMKRDDL